MFSSSECVLREQSWLSRLQHEGSLLFPFADSSSTYFLPPAASRGQGSTGELQDLQAQALLPFCTHQHQTCDSQVVGREGKGRGHLHKLRGL